MEPLRKRISILLRRDTRELTHSPHALRKGHVRTARRRPPATQRGSPHQTPALLTSPSQTSQPPNHEEIHLCYLNHPVHGVALAALAYSYPCHVGLSRGQREMSRGRTSRTEVSLSVTISDVTFHHFRPTQSFRVEPPSPAHTQGQGTTQGWKPLKVGSYRPRPARKDSSLTGLPKSARFLVHLLVRTEIHSQVIWGVQEEEGLRVTPHFPAWAMCLPTGCDLRKPTPAPRENSLMPMFLRYTVFPKARQVLCFRENSSVGWGDRDREETQEATARGAASPSLPFIRCEGCSSGPWGGPRPNRDSLISGPRPPELSCRRQEAERKPGGQPLSAPPCSSASEKTPPSPRCALHLAGGYFHCVKPKPLCRAPGSGGLASANLPSPFCPPAEYRTPSS
ncbi:hypothetical protein Cadr_000024117 [Camelus dromedarius]|uniref:Uncharacterized protein n=1 Tax=Camelus dromedarius TaxID=9838 RepID=A0A5N4CWA4_CAMDR|nr:hypothetical protein Cadr_000024117 [Camelus dromedarius]